MPFLSNENESKVSPEVVLVLFRLSVLVEQYPDGKVEAISPDGTSEPIDVSKEDLVSPKFWNDLVDLIGSS